MFAMLLYVGKVFLFCISCFGNLVFNVYVIRYRPSVVGEKVYPLNLKHNNMVN